MCFLLLEEEKLKNVPIRLQMLRVVFKIVVFFTIVTLFSLFTKPFNENTFLQFNKKQI